MAHPWSAQSAMTDSLTVFCTQNRQNNGVLTQKLSNNAWKQLKAMLVPSNLFEKYSSVKK